VARNDCEHDPPRTELARNIYRPGDPPSLLEVVGYIMLFHGGLISLILLEMGSC